VAETNRQRSLRESLKQHGQKVKQDCEVYHRVLPLVAEDVGPLPLILDNNTSLMNRVLLYVIDLDVTRTSCLS